MSPQVNCFPKKRSSCKCTVFIQSHNQIISTFTAFLLPRSYARYLEEMSVNSTFICIFFLLIFLLSYPVPQNALQFFYPIQSSKRQTKSTGVSAIISIPLYRFWKSKFESRLKSNASNCQRPTSLKEAEEDAYLMKKQK